jgi:hypothetical protein
MKLDIEAFKADIQKACKEPDIMSVCSVLMGYTYEKQIPTWTLNTAWLNDHRRQFVDAARGDFKYFKKLTDEQFLDKVRDYIRKGNPCLFLQADFWGTHTIYYYEGGIEPHVAISIKSGAAERLHQLVKELHS